MEIINISSLTHRAGKTAYIMENIIPRIILSSIRNETVVREFFYNLYNYLYSNYETILPEYREVSNFNNLINLYFLFLQSIANFLDSGFLSVRYTNEYHETINILITKINLSSLQLLNDIVDNYFIIDKEKQKRAQLYFLFLYCLDKILSIFESIENFDYNRVITIPRECLIQGTNNIIRYEFLNTRDIQISSTKMLFKNFSSALDFFNSIYYKVRNNFLNIINRINTKKIKNEIYELEKIIGIEELLSKHLTGETSINPKIIFKNYNQIKKLPVPNFVKIISNIRKYLFKLDSILARTNCKLKLIIWIENLDRIDIKLRVLFINYIVEIFKGLNILRNLEIILLLEDVLDINVYAEFSKNNNLKKESSNSDKTNSNNLKNNNKKINKSENFENNKNTYTNKLKLTEDFIIYDKVILKEDSIKNFLITYLNINFLTKVIRKTDIHSSIVCDFLIDLLLNKEKYLKNIEIDFKIQINDYNKEDYIELLPLDVLQNLIKNINDIPNYIKLEEISLYRQSFENFLKLIGIILLSYSAFEYCLSETFKSFKLSFIEIYKFMNSTIGIEFINKILFYKIINFIKEDTPIKNKIWINKNKLEKLISYLIRKQNIKLLIYFKKRKEVIVMELMFKNNFNKIIEIVFDYKKLEEKLFKSIKSNLEEYLKYYKLCENFS